MNMYHLQIQDYSETLPPLLLFPLDQQSVSLEMMKFTPNRYTQILMHIFKKKLAYDNTYSNI